MKGSLHSDELLGAVVAREGGLRTARRISHCFVIDVCAHPEILIVSDAAVNIAPTLADKVDIVQNAIEAAALCKMADRGQITGGIFDGPLALDNAINLQAAEIKHINSPVAGRANVLIVPDVESGNILTKSLTFLAGAAVLVARARRAVPSRAIS